ncbi:hypothetical protein [Streptomyces sp. NPDC059224]|uniref:hypothetical protein n=1 Tax=Streptomyces sp. NPDC059224 TaxID=3346775 RepID=UPI0036CA5FAD
MLCGRFPPQVLREEVYAFVALAGAGCRLLLDRVRVTGPAPMALGAAMVFAVRLTSIGSDLHLPARRTVEREQRGRRAGLRWPAAFSPWGRRPRGRQSD